MRSTGRCFSKFEWQDMSGGVVRELSEVEVKCMLLSVAWRNVKDEWRKEVHEKPKLSMMKFIGECEVELSCALLKSKAERRMMLKLRGGHGTAAFQIEMGRWHGMKRERRGYARNVTVERWRMYAIGCCSALHGTILGNLFWKPWTDQGRTFQQKALEREQPLYCHWLVRTIVYCLLLALYGQLDSIN